jgi:hypothetical protein
LNHVFAKHQFRQKKPWQNWNPSLLFDSLDSEARMDVVVP